uniref:Uncharacterized protein n=1 Tax=Timspurckia oligopyrenoides TaxID=708627 RepID=A0A7S0ZER2_9RHOD|mmetsp:Transcript_2296/g.4027  ORF Transcript_2296/g.4027 Transcript_2296/m.4027 type:complete len:104 (+) Transcript_2296:31-342(+)
MSYFNDSVCSEYAEVDAFLRDGYAAANRDRRGIRSLVVGVFDNTLPHQNNHVFDSISVEMMNNTMHKSKSTRNVKTFSDLWATLRPLARNLSIGAVQSIICRV